MYNSNIPTKNELPSTGKLIKSTIAAAITAAVLLITTVLPAEYGIDPTGLGKVLGLKKMGEIKVSLAEEVATDAAKDMQTTIQPKVIQPKNIIPSAVKINTDTASVTLAPNQGTEIKVKMQKGKTVTYKWASNAGKVNFDVHADSEALKIDYHNYEKGSQKVKEGSITAAFDGYHGWFWRNRTGEPLTVTLEVSGEYEYMKRVK